MLLLDILSFNLTIVFEPKSLEFNKLESEFHEKQTKVILAIEQHKNLDTF